MDYYKYKMTDKFLLRKKIWERTKNKYSNMNDIESHKYSNITNIDSNSEDDPRQIEIIKGDMINVAIEYKKKHHNPLVLNMADWNYAGGYINSNGCCQEEECFRRSNYFKHLHQKYYPLEIYDNILSKGVEYYCDNVYNEYNEYPQPFKIDMIASACILNLSESTNVDNETMKIKIRQILTIANNNTNDVLILSAWGCGSFGGCPKNLAKLFKEVITKWHECYPKYILFVINDDKNLNKFKEGF
jgi:uncharacterized protein (TIGR02452 family)